MNETAEDSPFDSVNSFETQKIKINPETQNSTLETSSTYNLKKEGKIESDEKKKKSKKLDMRKVTEENKRIFRYGIRGYQLLNSIFLILVKFE